MTTGLRILFATGLDYMPARVGGALQSIHDLSVALNARGVETAVLCAGAPDKPANEVQRDVYRGYQVYRARQPERAVAAVTRDFRPSAAVLQSGAIQAMTEAFQAAGVATMVYIRDAEFGGQMFLPSTEILFLANSAFTARRTEVMLGVDCHVLPSLIRLSEYRTETNRSRALFVGSSPRKGLEIAFRIAERRADIPFDFVESWPISEHRRVHYGARCARAGNIAWHRSVSDMRQFYATARLLLAPSVWEEAYGRVVPEAQISGIPVLASDRGGLPQAVGPGGILIDAHAPDADWLAAFDRMWDDDAEYSRLSGLAREHAEREEMAPGLITGRFLELVSDFIAARRGGA
ncbi:MAG: glycosyltransferase [Rhodospirillaceae bacterium]|nr:glycosyltransferase [Rhodospirillaceae bacterium]MBT5674641.1 glycosyltransferase [Rhodospirillaceae bacterium]MBT5778087.1 glycosyltransferase [Rhodospirillaceae bacterium]MBT7293651.1 glycosyltransferase [Rhodospirillaceae bacterium]